MAWSGIGLHTWNRRERNAAGARRIIIGVVDVEVLGSGLEVG